MSDENERKPDSQFVEAWPTELQGNRLLLARIVWGILVGLCLLTVVGGFPSYVKQTRDMMNALGVTDLSLNAQMMALIGPSLLLLIPMTIAGIMMFLARNEDWLGLCVSLTFLMNVALGSGIPAAL